MTWAATAALGPRKWAAGWDVGAMCPPDILTSTPKGGWRLVGAAGVGTWRDKQDRKRRVNRAARRAGYCARNRWNRLYKGLRRVGPHEVESWTYTSGPCVGLEAVDPWVVARKLSSCSSTWYAQARVTSSGQLRVIGLPRGCGLRHVCPVCASQRSQQLAAGLRDLMASQGGGAGALVTLTQRAVPGETLHHALERLRDGMNRLWTGRPKEDWLHNVPDWYYGIETTRGQKWWHVHVHVVIRASREHAQVAEYIGRRWEAASEAAAVEAGCPGSGWDPAAGGVVDSWVPSESKGWNTSKPWGWYRPIDLGDPVAVYQACKYPSPCVDLDPASLAEFLSVAHGRRWHDGGGGWRGASARADELRHSGAVDEEGEDPGAYDIGTNVSRCGPKEAPALDDITPGLGLVDERCRNRAIRRAKVTERSSWLLSDRFTERELLTCAALEVAGDVYQDEKGRWLLELPTATAAALVREWQAATTTDRPQREPAPEP